MFISNLKMIVGKPFKEMKIITILVLISLTLVKTEDFIETPDGEIPIDEVSTNPGIYYYIILF